MEKTDEEEEKSGTIDEYGKNDEKSGTIDECSEDEEKSDEAESSIAFGFHKDDIHNLTSVKSGEDEKENGYVDGSYGSSSDISIHGEFEEPLTDSLEISKTTMQTLESISVGQLYSSKTELQHKLQLNFDFVTYKSTKDLLVLKCYIAGCSWKIRASAFKSTSEFKVRKYIDIHTCPVTQRSSRHLQHIYGHRSYVIGGKIPCVVDIQHGTCTCHVYDLDGIPCQHALAAVGKRQNLHFENLVSPYHSKINWYNAYADSVNPGSVEPPIDGPTKKCLPPLQNRDAGRPNKSRYLSALEKAMGNQPPNKKIRKEQMFDEQPTQSPARSTHISLLKSCSYTTRQDKKPEEWKERESCKEERARQLNGGTEEGTEHEKVT
ncbi:unnamed protein product [Thlaspi arvense]|uniref:SWIM-type domain-containing protein n=1 Tax=Thlaspi arvense TaxID=13288 RepID=A0AAU9TAR9_THLAR|nr:unnamed protein product [Thlaspi arvense]